MRDVVIMVMAGCLFIINGCEIEEYPGSSNVPNGSIYVSARDSDGLAIDDATIFVDGIERHEKTPSYIHGLIEGLHEIAVKSFGFWNESSTVEVSGGDTVSVDYTMRAVPPDQVGFLNVFSVPASAVVLVDGGRLLADDLPVTTPAGFILPWGTYSISVNLDHYATVHPLLPVIQVSVTDTTYLSFNLESTETGLEEGLLPFDFSLGNDLGDPVTLNNLKGYVVLVNFWFKDCVPCMREFPGIESVYKNNAANGFRILAINPMFSDDLEDVAFVREELGLTFQLLLDLDHSVTGLYNVRAFPLNVLVDRTGRISAIMQSVEEDELDAQVRALLDAGSG